jgi:hypothetical protein
VPPNEDRPASQLDRAWYAGRDWLTLQEATNLAALSAGLPPYVMTYKEYQALYNKEASPRLLILRRHIVDGSLKTRPNPQCPDERRPDGTMVKASDLRRLFALKGWPWPLDQPVSSKPEWPWGTYDTQLLRDLAAAVDHFWAKFDPSKPLPKTASNQKEVSAWLVKNRGVPARTADEIARIIQPK